LDGPIRAFATLMRAPRVLILRLGLAGLVGLALSALAGERILGATMPMLQRSFEWAAPDFRVLEFGIGQVQAERRIAVVVTLARTTVVGSRALVPNARGRAEAVTPMAHALQGPVLALIGVAAWPASSRRALLCRLMLAAPVALLLLLADAPLVLAASLQQLLIDALAPGEASLLVAWSQFLRGGGRYALALLAAALAIGACTARSQVKT
jgi:hypothetical protein